ncbi:hypothetical protein [Cupriavidus basilensis]|uniref:hypothetical protein n=1 Tax=Cupriavidus basilensis TaxID=68895 RepID=UPI0039F657A9
MNVLEREQRIRALAAQIEASQDRDEQRRIFTQMAELIRGRSPDFVAGMELARGLVPGAAPAYGRG